MTVDGKQIQKDLPLDQPVELTQTFRTAGVIHYACAMDMMRGTITVR
jgi:plastocyanin